MNQKTIILDVRWYRGLDIALTRRILKGGKSEDGDHYRYAYVQSQHANNVYYRVTEDGTCECPDFYYRGFPCKHIFSVIHKGGMA